jgi:hypothetical protein
VRWAWTDGLRTSEPPQAELGSPLRWPVDERRDAQVERLLTFLARYVSRHGKPILAGQTLRYGWTLLRAEHAPPELFPGEPRLKLQELADPFAEQTSPFADGVTSAIALLEIQEQAIARNHVTGTAEHPHRGDTALVCSHVAPGGGTPLTLTRQTLTDRQFHYSGWFAGCQDRTHNHDEPDQLHGVQLSHLVARYPWTFAYLGMPAGTRVALDGERIVVFRPDERRGRLDDARPFALPLLLA